MTAAPAPYHRSCIIPCICLHFVLSMHFGNFFFVVSALMGWELGRTGSNPRSCQRLHLPRPICVMCILFSFFVTLCGVIWSGGQSIVIRWEEVGGVRGKQTESNVSFLLNPPVKEERLFCYNLYNLNTNIKVRWWEIQFTIFEKYSHPSSCQRRNLCSTGIIWDKCMYIRPIHSRLICNNKCRRTSTKLALLTPLSLYSLQLWSIWDGCYGCDFLHAGNPPSNS